MRTNSRVADHHGVLHCVPPGESVTTCWHNGAPLGCEPTDEPAGTAFDTQPDPLHTARCRICYPAEETP